MQGPGQNNMYKSDQELECRISAGVRYTVVIRVCVADEKGTAYRQIEQAFASLIVC
jgi:hypothetical protein